MSIALWRQKVSTSNGCKELFQSANFKSELLKCLMKIHESSMKLLQTTNNNSIDVKSINEDLQNIILLYRTIRNLASINEQSKWIVTESSIIINIVEYLNVVFIKLSSIVDEDELFVLLCDIIRAAFQLFCNLSFNEFNDNTIHLALWQQFYSSQSSSNTISSWIDQLFMKMCKDNKYGIIMQTNISRILEPIVAFLHEFIVNHQDCIKDDELNIIIKALYNIQLIDVKCFGNNKNYLYQKMENENKSNDNGNDDDKDEDDDDNDEFDKWKHHEWIRKLMPYFINSNGLTFYIDNLNQETINLYYFQVSVELLFEMTESILIDIKTPSLKQDVQMMQQQKINLIQHVLKPTFVKLMNVIDYSLKHVFPLIFKNMENNSDHYELINICQHILEILSNVSLISSSIENKMDKIQYQNDLMNGFGVIMVESMKILQNKSEKMVKYCKDNKMSDDKFNDKYSGTISKILSFRRQFVSIISTLCCDNKLNQDYIRNNGVIEILLNMTKIDRFTMFLQQWSIFAVKNITSNNLENQQYIQSIKAQKVIQNEEMKNLGIKITYDEITGKIVAKKNDE